MGGGGWEERGKGEEEVGGRREQERSITGWDLKPERGFITPHPHLSPAWELARAHENCINCLSSQWHLRPHLSASIQRTEGTLLEHHLVWQQDGS